MNLTGNNAIDLALALNKKQKIDTYTVTLSTAETVICSGISSFNDDAIKTMNTSYFYFKDELVKQFFHHLEFKDTDGNKKVLEYKDFLENYCLDDLKLCSFGIVLATYKSLSKTTSLCSNKNCQGHYIDLESLKDMDTEKAKDIIDDKLFEVEVLTDNLRISGSNWKAFEHDDKRKDEWEKTIDSGCGFTFTLSFPSIKKSLEIERNFTQTEIKKNIEVYKHVLPRKDVALYYIKSIDGFIGSNPISVTNLNEIKTFLNALGHEMKGKFFDLLSENLESITKYSPTTHMDVTCPSCGHKESTEIDLISMFFRKTLSIHS